MIAVQTTMHVLASVPPCWALDEPCTLIDAAGCFSTSARTKLSRPYPGGPRRRRLGGFRAIGPAAGGRHVPEPVGLDRFPADGAAAVPGGFVPRAQLRRVQLSPGLLPPEPQVGRPGGTVCGIASSTTVSLCEYVCALDRLRYVGSCSHPIPSAHQCRLLPSIAQVGQPLAANARRADPGLL